MLNFLKRKFAKPIPFTEQVRILAECGIKLSPRVRPESLLSSCSAEAVEKDPYRLLLCVMGGEAELEEQAGESGYPSDNIWHFDTECIEDHGDYKRIAARLSSLAQGDLPLEEIRDFVDLEEDTAWLSFTLDGHPHRWDAKVDNDWVDPEIMSQFARLLERRGTGRRFTYIHSLGQDCLIGCSTVEEKARLEAATGWKIEWMR